MSVTGDATGWAQARSGLFGILCQAVAGMNHNLDSETRE